MQVIEPGAPAFVTLPHPNTSLRYSAWGLKISSRLPLPEFLAAVDDSVAPDIEIVFGAGERWIARMDEPPKGQLRFAFAML